MTSRSSRGSAGSRAHAQVDLELLVLGLQRRQLFARHARHLGVGVVRHLARFGDLLVELVQAAREADDLLEGRALLGELGQALVVGSEVGAGHLVVEGLVAVFEGAELVLHCRVYFSRRVRLGPRLPLQTRSGWTGRFVIRKKTAPRPESSARKMKPAS